MLGTNHNTSAVQNSDSSDSDMEEIVEISEPDDLTEAHQVPANNVIETEEFPCGNISFPESMKGQVQIEDSDATVDND